MGLTELFEGSTGHDIAMLAIAIFGIPFVCMLAITWVLKFIVGLRSTPDHRAFVTVLPAYVIVTLIFLFSYSGMGALQLALALATVPVAAIFYWWWRREFRASWVDSPEQLAEGVGLANADWKIGAGVVVGMVVAAAIKVLFIRGSIGG